PQTAAGCRVERAGHVEIRVGDDLVGVQLRRRLRVPWIRVGRVPRFGRGLATDPAQVVRALMDVARRERLATLRVELWNESAPQRQELADALLAAGFRACASPRSYRDTVWIDLARSDEDLLATFHATCRRHIR